MRINNRMMVKMKAKAPLGKWTLIWLLMVLARGRMMTMKKLIIKSVGS